MRLLDLPPEMIRAVALELDCQSLYHCLFLTKPLTDILQSFIYWRHGSVVLAWAAKKGNMEVIQNMQKTVGLASVDAHCKNKSLLDAAEQGHEDIVRLLLNHGADPDFATKIGDETTVDESADEELSGNESADDEPSDPWSRHGRTPLSFAAEKGHDSLVRLLLNDPRVDPNSKGRRGRTPLSYTAANGCDAVVNLLLEVPGIQPDLEDDLERSPLSCAAHNLRGSTMVLLLSIDLVDPNAKYSDTPVLTLTVEFASLEPATQLLLDKGAIVDTPDESGVSGLTALYHAAWARNVNAVKLLLAWGANPHPVQAVLVAR